MNARAINSAIAPASRPWRCSFIACALRRGHCAELIQLYANYGHWRQTRRAALDSNLVQARTLSSRQRVTSELVARLSRLAPQELALLPALPQQGQNYLLWLALCRAYGLVAAFATELLYENFITYKNFVTKDDFNIFFQEKTLWHPELDKLAESTKKKIPQALFQLMAEAGIVAKNGSVTNFQERFLQ